MSCLSGRGTPSGRRIAAVVLTLLALLAAGAGDVAAQDNDKVRGDTSWKEDPYTKNDPEVMAAAGYVAFDRLPWGDGHNTPDIQAALGEIELIFVETAHFRIGCSLPELRVGKDDRKLIKGDLERLKKRLPGVRASTKELDPWLRAHVYAMRLEELYADFAQRLGVTDDDFPETEVAQQGGVLYMGAGPYLGQKEKFTVLLFEKESSLGRYAARWGPGGYGPQRLNFPVTGTLCFATCSEFFEDDYDNDMALWCHVLWNVTQNMVEGYKSFRHSVPVWWSEGLAHWYVRNVEPRFCCFSKLRENPTDVMDDWRWEPKVRARVGYDVYPRAAQMLAWPPGETRTFADNTMMWSRVDYLMSLGDDGFATFMSVLSDPIPTPPGEVPSFDAVLERQELALLAAWDLDEETFDERWAEYVADNYKRK